jgi:acetyltransferase-like isoleucine patch superfamily enzyme
MMEENRKHSFFFNIVLIIINIIDDIVATLITPIEGKVGSWIRYFYYRLILKKCDGYFSSFAGFKISGCKYVSIGKNCSFNRGVWIGASDEITIGNDVMVGPYTFIRNGNHRYKDLAEPMRLQGHESGKVIIGNDVWIGGHVAILKDVEIKDHSLIAAHSLINKNIGEYEIWGGVPATLIRNRRESK